MATVPSKNAEKIQYYEDHIARFTTNAVAIGTTAADVTDLTTKTTAARAAYAAQQLALSTTKDLTLACEEAVRAMGVKGASIIKQVRAKGESTGNANVYVLAGIPAPATPSNRPAPGVPFAFKAAIGGDGALEMKWKCNNPPGSAGTMYQIYRSSNGTTDFQLVGGSGQRTFADDTIPANITYVTYKIQAMRSTVKGGWATFNVYFGSNAGGSVVASVQTVPVKIAA